MVASARRFRLGYRSAFIKIMCQKYLQINTEMVKETLKQCSVITISVFRFPHVLKWLKKLNLLAQQVVLLPHISRVSGSNPELGLLSVWSLCVYSVMFVSPGFQRASESMPVGGAVYRKLTLAVHMCECCSALDCCLMDIFLPHAQCSWDRLWLYCDLNRTEAVAINK